MDLTIARWNSGIYSPSTDTEAVYVSVAEPPEGLDGEELAVWLEQNARYLEEEELENRRSTRLPYYPALRPGLGELGHGYVGSDGEYHPKPGEIVFSMHDRGHENTWDPSSPRRVWVRRLN
jgi:hypothetical protein